MVTILDGFKILYKITWEEYFKLYSNSKYLDIGNGAA